MFKYVSKDNYTNIEKGIVYGLFFGGAVAFFLYIYGIQCEVAVKTTWILAGPAIGLVAGLIIGGSMPETKSAAKKTATKKKKKK